MRRRQVRNWAQIAINVQVRAWVRVTAEEHRAEHLSYLRLRLIASVRGSESAAHLALLSGHAKANGGAGQGIESVTDDQVTLRHHGGARTKGTFHRPIAFLRSNLGFLQFFFSSAAPDSPPTGQPADSDGCRVLSLPRVEMGRCGPFGL